ncbi:TetR/AcrR family transcriptional regulator [Streptomyces sp. NPDC097619]|uniref:TetR/AcrR family transcriptional regulator n=1 Tax=Streptomyces sp. NPDC097619 TaxID=3157228 RepID=UPI00331DFD8C
MVTGQRGRPRSFDREAALGLALTAFWERGYENTSVADLTREMGITPPSLYAAFGDKRALFDEVVTAYAARYAGFLGVALAEEPTARAAVARVLREAAEIYTDPAHPAGCLVVSTVHCGVPEISEAMRERRNATIEAVRTRIAADVAAGVLPPGTDPAALARFYAAVVQGMSQQARDGAGRQELLAVAERAVLAWP